MAVKKRKTLIVHVIAPAEHVEALDRKAEQENLTRSDVVRQILRRQYETDARREAK